MEKRSTSKQVSERDLKTKLFNKKNLLQLKIIYNGIDRT